MVFSGAPYEGNGALYHVTLAADGEAAGTVRFAPADPNFFAGETTARFGTSALDLGDRNGDGNPDYLVGAPGVQPFGALIYMYSNGDVFNYTMIDLPSEFQEAVAQIGEFLALDAEAILINTASGAGKIYRCTLSENGELTLLETIGSDHPLLAPKLESGDRFGTGLSVADMNNDGITDILCGAVGDDDQGADFGAVYVLIRDGSGAIQSVRKYSRFEGDFGGFLNTDDDFGISVRSIGDLDQNGIVDLAVGAPGDDDGGLDIGSIWILFIREDGTVLDERKINRLAGNFTGDINFQDRFGTRLAVIGDHDGDGTNDLAVGSIEDDDGGTNRGAFFSIFIEHCPAPSGLFGFEIDGAAVQFTAEGGPTYSHIWNFDDGGYSQLQNPVYTYQSTGTFWVCLAINSDCGGDNYCQNVQISTLSVEDRWAESVRIYPNPSSTFVELRWPDDVSLIRFLDITGKEVLSYIPQGNSNRLETSDFQVGLYIVEFSGLSHKAVRKWSKIR